MRAKASRHGVVVYDQTGQALSAPHAVLMSCSSFRVCATPRSMFGAGLSSCEVIVLHKMHEGRHGSETTRGSAAAAEDDLAAGRGTAAAETGAAP